MTPVEKIFHNLYREREEINECFDFIVKKYRKKEKLDEKSFVDLKSAIKTFTTELLNLEKDIK